VIQRVEIARVADRQLQRAPQHVTAKLLAWIEDVEARGLEEVRKVPGYNDHPLKGQLDGKRAIRLSRKWRAVYEIKASGAGQWLVEFAEIQEVHAHDY
jgi:proteic killer suppression protein